MSELESDKYLQETAITWMKNLNDKIQLLEKQKQDIELELCCLRKEKEISTKGLKMRKIVLESLEESPTNIISTDPFIMMVVKVLTENKIGYEFKDNQVICYIGISFKWRMIISESSPSHETKDSGEALSRRIKLEVIKNICLQDTANRDANIGLTLIYLGYSNGIKYIGSLNDAISDYNIISKLMLGYEDSL